MPTVGTLRILIEADARGVISSFEKIGGESQKMSADLRRRGEATVGFMRAQMDLVKGTRAEGAARVELINHLKDQQARYSGLVDKQKQFGEWNRYEIQNATKGLQIQRQINDLEKQARAGRAVRLDDVRSLGFALTGAGAALGAGLMKTVKMAGEEEASLRHLDAAIKSVGSTASAASLSAYAEDLARTRLVTDEEIRGSEALLLSMGANEGAVRKLLPVILDLSAAYGKDLDTTTRAVGKSMAGSSTALTRFGILMGKDAVKAAQDFDGWLAQLAVRAPGAAEAMARGSGQIEIMRKQLGETAEAIGGILLPRISEWATAIAAQADQTRTWIAQNPGFAAGLVEDAAGFAAVATAAGPILIMLPQIIKQYKLLFVSTAEYTSVAKAAWTSTLGPIGLVAAALVGLYEGTKLWTQHTEYAAAGIPKLTAKVADLGAEADRLRAGTTALGAVSESQANTVALLVRRYEDLHGKVGLTSKQEAELRSVMAQIHAISPGLIASFDGQNRALTLMAGAAGEARKALDALRQAQFKNMAMDIETQRKAVRQARIAREDAQAKADIAAGRRNVDLWSLQTWRRSAEMQLHPFRDLEAGIAAAGQREARELGRLQEMQKTLAFARVGGGAGAAAAAVTGGVGGAAVKHAAGAAKAAAQIQDLSNVLGDLLKRQYETAKASEDFGLKEKAAADLTAYLRDEIAYLTPKVSAYTAAYVKQIEALSRSHKLTKAEADQHAARSKAYEKLAAAEKLFDTIQKDRAATLADLKKAWDDCAASMIWGGVDPADVAADVKAWKDREDAALGAYRATAEAAKGTAAEPAARSSLLAYLDKQVAAAEALVPPNVEIANMTIEQIGNLEEALRLQGERRDIEDGIAGGIRDQVKAQADLNAEFAATLDTATQGELARRNAVLGMLRDRYEATKGTADQVEAQRQFVAYLNQEIDLYRAAAPWEADRTKWSQQAIEDSRHLRDLLDIRDQFKAVAKAAWDWKVDMSKMMTDWQSGFTDTLVSALQDGEDLWRQFGDAVVTQLMRISTQYFITEPLFKWLTSLIPGLGGAAAAHAAPVPFVGNLPGEPVPVMSVPRQGGGYVAAGQRAWVGERGPEMIVPALPSYVIPAAAAAAGAGNVTIHQPIHLHLSVGVPETVRRELAQQLPALKRAAADGVADGINRGGRLARRVGAQGR